MIDFHNRAHGQIVERGYHPATLPPEQSAGGKMHMHQVINFSGSYIACRRPVPADLYADDALAYAKELATDCIIELWRHDELLASFGPELAIETN